MGPGRGVAWFQALVETKGSLPDYSIPASRWTQTPYPGPNRAHAIMRPSISPAKHLLLSLALLALAGPLRVSAAAPADDEGLTPMPDRPAAPAFDLKDPQDRPQWLADYRGKTVILTFWAIWCPPCREEMPSM